MKNNKIFDSVERFIFRHKEGFFQKPIKEADKREIEDIVESIFRHNANITAANGAMAKDFDKLVKIVAGSKNQIYIPTTRIADAERKHLMLASTIKIVEGVALIGGRSTAKTYKAEELSPNSIMDLTNAICRKGEGTSKDKERWVTFRDRTKVSFHTPRQFVVKCKDRKQALGIADYMKGREKFNFVRVSANKPNRPQAIELDVNNWEQEVKEKVFNYNFGTDNVLV